MVAAWVVGKMSELYLVLLWWSVVPVTPMRATYDLHMDEDPHTAFISAKTKNGTLMAMLGPTLFETIGN